jgi:hypothetical protein
MIPQINNLIPAPDKADQQLKIKVYQKENIKATNNSKKNYNV